MNQEKILYVVYVYHPDNPVYFDQADVFIVECNLLLDEIVEKICIKNSCKSYEIELLNIFRDKERLNLYLSEHDLKYLIK